jgi:hypothetical protein
MAEVLHGKGYIFGAKPSTFVLYPNDNAAAVEGYVVPSIEGANLTYSANLEEVMNDDGEIVATIHTGGYIEASFDLLPEGATIADAKSSARIPEKGDTLVITGMPVVACGPFSDAFNVTTGGGTILDNRWVAVGNGSLRLVKAGKATATAVFRRYENIAPTVGITS